jgi:ribosome-binding protein aMBF1 (putative translation factor)
MTTLPQPPSDSPLAGSAADVDSRAGQRRLPVFPGFKEMAERRHELVSLLEGRRVVLGLTQTEVAARMGTSQSAVARLESGDADVRLSTLERYAAAIGHELSWRLTPVPPESRE